MREREQSADANGAEFRGQRERDANRVQPPVVVACPFLPLFFFYKFLMSLQNGCAARGFCFIFRTLFFALEGLKVTSGLHINCFPNEGAFHLKNCLYMCYLKGVHKLGTTLTHLNLNLGLVGDFSTTAS